jgi:hypothetical protein
MKLFFILIDVGDARPLSFYSFTSPCSFLCGDLRAFYIFNGDFTPFDGDP